MNLRNSSYLFSSAIQSLFRRIEVVTNHLIMKKFSSRIIYHFSGPDQRQIRRGRPIPKLFRLSKGSEARAATGSCGLKSAAELKGETFKSDCRGWLRNQSKPGLRKFPGRTFKSDLQRWSASSKCALIRINFGNLPMKIIRSIGLLILFAVAGFGQITPRDLFIESF